MVFVHVLNFHFSDFIYSFSWNNNWLYLIWLWLDFMYILLLSVLLRDYNFSFSFSSLRKCSKLFAASLLQIDAWILIWDFPENFNNRFIWMTITECLKEPLQSITKNQARKQHLMCCAWFFHSLNYQFERNPHFHRKQSTKYTHLCKMYSQTYNFFRNIMYIIKFKREIERRKQFEIILGIRNRMCIVCCQKSSKLIFRSIRQIFVLCLR